MFYCINWTKSLKHRKVLKPNRVVSISHTRYFGEPEHNLSCPPHCTGAMSLSLFRFLLHTVELQWVGIWCFRNYFIAQVSQVSRWSGVIVVGSYLLLWDTIQRWKNTHTISDVFVETHWKNKDLLLNCGHMWKCLKSNNKNHRFILKHFFFKLFMFFLIIG